MKAEQQNIKRLLNTAKGQIDGLNKMIDDDKYCIDISNQIMATIAILKKVNIEILDAHLKCVFFTQMTVNVKPRSTKYPKCSRKH